MALTVSQLLEFNDAITILTDVFLALSLFGEAATIITFLIFNEMRTYPIKLIVYLCASMFFGQFFFFFTFYAYETIMCIPCAMILHYFFLSTFFWTYSVAFNFYQMIVRRNRDAESYEKIYHLASWGLPLIVVIIVVATNSYQNRGGYCYMSPGFPIFLSFFLPGLIIVSANAVIFFFIAREIHDTLKSAPSADKKEKSKEFKVYFSIFVSIGVSWIFGFVMSLLDGVAADIFLVLYSVLTPLQGFLIFISYCVNAKVGSKWAKLIGRVIPFFKRYQNLGDSSATSSTSNSSSARSSTSGSVSNGVFRDRNSSDSSISMSNISARDSVSGSNSGSEV